MSHAIQTADLDWQVVDGIDIPMSKQFGDVYFSKDNGLLETRHVFLSGNDLPDRLANLKDFEYFSVGETGFGTGLNILALWQLWQQVRPHNHSHLHVISVEKFPLKKIDLIRALNAWPELQPLAQQLISQYPYPIAGCHRLSFPQERFSIDLWLGDAHDVFPRMKKTHQVNAWFLDGFAPSCNPDMWEDNVLSHIVRLSGIGSTFASFSVAGVLKRGLKKHGLEISRPRGFGHKREMLKAIWSNTQDITPSSMPIENTEPTSICEPKQRHIAIIGAGIAGLSCAWAFAQRGHKVVIYDQSAPLSGGSGNPLALLNPKLSSIEHSHEHLMTLAWPYALQFYQPFQAFRPIQINQLVLKDIDETLQLAEQYPEGIFATQSAEQSLLKTESPSLNLLQTACIYPHQLKDQILQHQNIQYTQAEITQITQVNDANRQVNVFTQHQLLDTFDHAIVCTARHNAQFFENHPKLKPIRGQVSWFNNKNTPLPVELAYSYAGYCMQLDTEHLLLGASFYPNSDDENVRHEDHVHNYQLIHNAFPDFAVSLESIDTWEGRASIRAQSPDYFPLLGNLKDHDEVYSFTGLGSKGFLFSPLCSEVLAALILQEACPVSTEVFQKINVRRFQKKVRVRKPYYKPPI